jgi:hypothetical protein
MKYLVEIGSFQSSGRIRAAIHHSQNYFDARARRKFSSWANWGWESLPDFLKLAYLPAIGQSAFEAVSKRKTKAFLKRN